MTLTWIACSWEQHRHCKVLYALFINVETGTGRLSARSARHAGQCEEENT